MAFTDELWRGIEPIYAAILRHPFLRGLTDGSLPRESFQFYAVQEALHLRGLARSTLHALDRYLRLRRVRRRRPGGARSDQRDRRPDRCRGAPADDPPLHDDQPLRVDVLEHGPDARRMARVNVVLFDLDDTLLDYSGDAARCWSEACATVAAPA